DVERGSVVVLGRDGEVRAADLAAREPQALERLRAGDLVHEVEVDVEEVGRPVGASSHQVRVPDLLRQRAGHVAHLLVVCHGAPGGYGAPSGSIVRRPAACRGERPAGGTSPPDLDRKSTRLNSSHVKTSYAVF